MATTLTPFLYQTRTILRASVALRSFSTTAGHLGPRPRARGEESIPFEWESSAEQQPDIPSGPDSAERSTITPSERHIFRKIFDDIATRTTAPGRRPPLGSLQGRDASEAALGQLSEAGSRDAILSKYPPALRRAAQAALGMREVPDDQPDRPFVSRISFKPEEDPESDALASGMQAARDELRQLEATRLQELLDECNTDVEVWDVLESEVFSMVEKLGIADEKPQEGKKTDASKKPKPTLNMDSHGPIYSMFLLQGLKTLDQAFTTSSPLALNVLPRVKELGLASYVLGVSTPFYNELASILWYRHGDAQAVLAVLDEMQYAGLFYDKQTLRLVDTIELALDSFRDRQLGVFSKAVGTIPGYNLDVKAKFARYARRVRHTTRQRLGSARY